MTTRWELATGGARGTAGIPELYLRLNEFAKLGNLSSLVAKKSPEPIVLGACRGSLGRPGILAAIPSRLSL